MLISQKKLAGIVEYKSKNQKDLQQHLKESLDQKLTLKIPTLLNSLQQKGIPENKVGQKKTIIKTSMHCLRYTAPTH